MEGQRISIDLSIPTCDIRYLAICSFAILVRSSRLGAANKLVRGVLVMLSLLTDVAGVNEVVSFGPFNAALHFVRPGVLFLTRLHVDRLVPLRTCVLHVPPCSPSRVLSLDACGVHCVRVTGRWSVVCHAGAFVRRGWCVSGCTDASVKRLLLGTC